MTACGKFPFLYGDTTVVRSFTSARCFDSTRFMHVAPRDGELWITGLRNQIRSFAARPFVGPPFLVGLNWQSPEPDESVRKDAATLVSRLERLALPVSS